MNDNNKQQLEQQLWNIANTLRGKMEADDFRDYIFVFIFYKYLRARKDIDKIVNVYQKRKTEDKYSYVAGLEEVRENEHNLNIPRYVDTF